MTVPEVLLTQEEVAARLKIRPKTVGDYLRAGKLTGVKIGRLWRIREADVRRFIASQVVSS
jgi:excisionase family DNA binding protein